MKKHRAFNFLEGAAFGKMGASWFVSYSYYDYIDNNHRNWERVTDSMDHRIGVYRRNKNMHKFWLGEVLKMSENRMSGNHLGLTGATVKQMAKKVLAVLESC